jgi:hypothetical protein
MVHITDLHTIDRMHVMEPTTGARNGISPSLLLKITSLSIVLKLPLHFYESLEKLERFEDVLEDTSDDIRAWLRIDSTMRLFHNLKRLQIWFEHNDSCTWTVVNERVLVSPLARLIQDKDIEMRRFRYAVPLAPTTATKLAWDHECRRYLETQLQSRLSFLSRDCRF